MPTLPIASIMSGGMGGGKNTLVAAGSGFALVSSLKMMRFIPEGHVGVRERLGRAHRQDKTKLDRRGEPYRLLRNRVAFGWPLSDSIKLVSVQDDFCDLTPGNERLLVDRTDVGQLAVRASILFGIPNEDNAILNAYYRLKDGADLGRNAGDICASGLSTVIANVKRDELSDPKAIDNYLHEEVDSSMESFGINLRRLNLIQVARNLNQHSMVPPIQNPEQPALTEQSPDMPNVFQVEFAQPGA